MNISFVILLLACSDPSLVERTVNRHPLTSMESSLEAYESLHFSNTAIVELERNGQTMELTFELRRTKDTP